MSHRYCPCGIRLDRSSAVRPLQDPLFRMFMSIRSLKPLINFTKACNVCRHLFDKWRKENPEYGGVVNYMESGGSEVQDDDTNSVRK